MRIHSIQLLCLSVIFTMAFGIIGLLDSSAHHGWGWAEDEEFEITGRITALRLGNPHGEVSLEVDNEIWTIEVGQPWRNKRAGLTTEVLFVGKTVTVHGHRSAKEGVRLVKAERVVIDGKDYNLYPDRES